MLLRHDDVYSLIYLSLMGFETTTLEFSTFEKCKYVYNNVSVSLCRFLSGYVKAVDLQAFLWTNDLLTISIDHSG